MQPIARLRRARLSFFLATALAGCVLVRPALAEAQIPGLADVVSGLPRLWVAFGLAGVAGGGVESGLGLHVQGVVQRYRHQVTLRALGLAEIAGIGDGLDGGVGELGLLYGRAQLERWTHASISSGLSWVRLSDCDTDGGACNTLGVPVVREAAVQNLFDRSRPAALR